MEINLAVSFVSIQPDKSWLWEEPKKVEQKGSQLPRKPFSLALNIVENQTKKLLLQKMGRTDFPTRSRFSIPKGGLTTAPPFCLPCLISQFSSKKLTKVLDTELFKAFQKESPDVLQTSSFLKTLQNCKGKRSKGDSYLNDFVMIESDNRVNPIRAGNDKHPWENPHHAFSQPLLPFIFSLLSTRKNDDLLSYQRTLHNSAAVFSVVIRAEFGVSCVSSSAFSPSIMHKKWLISHAKWLTIDYKFR